MAKFYELFNAVVEPLFVLTADPRTAIVRTAAI